MERQREKSKMDIGTQGKEEGQEGSEENKREGEGWTGEGGEAEGGRGGCRRRGKNVFTLV